MMEMMPRRRWKKKNRRIEIEQRPPPEYIILSLFSKDFNISKLVFDGSTSLRTLQSKDIKDMNMKD